MFTETESWEREHKGRKSKTVERLERIVPGEGHTRGRETRDVRLKHGRFVPL